jgi:PhnB protein
MGFHVRQEAQMPVKPIPDGYHSLTPTAAVKGCAAAVEAYAEVFGAELLLRLDYPDGTIAHCELRIGDSRLMMGEANPQVPAHGVAAMLYVPDCDAVFARAVAAGFTVKEPLEVKFWGDRTGRVEDRWGNEWMIGTHVEDVEPDELARRMKQLTGG